MGRLLGTLCEDCGIIFDHKDALGQHIQRLHEQPNARIRELQNELRYLQIKIQELQRQYGPIHEAREKLHEIERDSWIKRKEIQDSWNEIDRERWKFKK